MSEPTPTPPPLPRLQPRPLWRDVMDEHEELEEGDQMGNQRIGGWLILFGIGRVLSPLFMAAALVTDLKAFLKPGVWSALTSPGSATYHPLWSAAIVYEAAGNALFLLVSIVLVCLFFARWRAFPPVMIGFMVGLVLFYGGECFFSLHIPAFSEEARAEQIGMVIGGAITALIWTPYFLVSTRVRRTFVR